MSADAAPSQSALDERNAGFWDELCGSALARQVGVADASADSLARFDAAYMAHYPYLDRYLPPRLDGAEVLEIGLGYGTLSGELMRRGARYQGVDIAAGPVEMVRHRMRLAGLPHAEEHVVQASALSLPYAAHSFDRVFTIGCLHHTGHTGRAVAEVHRVLRPGGTAVVMLYNKHSFRQLAKVELPRLLRRVRSRDQVAAMYDTNAAGEAAPHVEYASRRDVRRMFAPFARVEIAVHNFDSTRFVPRERLLGNVDRVLGLDLYITARA
jgi:SAM-dependent methyltransferase